VGATGGAHRIVLKKSQWLLWRPAWKKERKMGEHEAETQERKRNDEKAVKNGFDPRGYSLKNSTEYMGGPHLRRRCEGSQPRKLAKRKTDTTGGSNRKRGGSVKRGGSNELGGRQETGQLPREKEKLERPIMDKKKKTQKEKKTANTPF